MKNTLSRLFSWAPSTDTGLAVFSEVLMVISAYLGLSLFGENLLNPIVFGLIFIFVFYGIQKIKKFHEVN